MSGEGGLLPKIAAPLADLALEIRGSHPAYEPLLIVLGHLAVTARAGARGDGDVAVTLHHLGGDRPRVPGRLPAGRPAAGRRRGRPQDEPDAVSAAADRAAARLRLIRDRAEARKKTRQEAAVQRQRGGWTPERHAKIKATRARKRAAEAGDHAG